VSKENRGLRIAVVVLGGLVIVLGVLLWRSTRSAGGGDDPRAIPDKAPLQGRQMNQRRQPRPMRNELGQPTDLNGKPISPRDKLVKRTPQRIEPGEVPITPPLFDDENDRARYRAWWVEELTRRASVYKTLEPGDYPSDDEIAELLAKFYDAAEPRRPGESIEDAHERRKQYRDLWQQFLDEMGATAKTVATRGGDPQFGEPTEPPVQPPGADEPPPEPTPQPEPGDRGEVDRSGDVHRPGDADRAGGAGP